MQMIHICTLSPDDIDPIHFLTEYINDINLWMSENFLQLNKDKTTSCSLTQIKLRLCFLHTFDGISLPSNTSIKNLGVIINQDLLLESTLLLRRD